MHRKYTTCLVLLVLGFTVFLYHHFASQKPPVRQSCRASVHRILLACALYAEDYDKFLPDGASAMQIRAPYMDPKCSWPFGHPDCPVGTLPYEFNESRVCWIGTHDYRHEPYLWDKRGNHGGRRIVGFSNGSVSSLTELEFEGMMRLYREKNRPLTLDEYHESIEGAERGVDRKIRP